MPFINEILKYRSLSIVGLEKNTGKTECLNYILNRLPVESRRVCVTSIGLDGETVDSVTKCAKPEISLRGGCYFATSEKHYRSRRVVSEVLDVSDENTALGRIVTAKALYRGNVLLSGPSFTSSLRRWMDSLKQFDISLTIIDGALSRMSSASPAVSESMILSTGAAYSANLSTLVRNTAFVVEMIGLPYMEEGNGKVVKSVSAISTDGFFLDDCDAVVMSGALTDRFLKQMTEQKRVGEVEIVVKDFTKIFITPAAYRSFVKAGGRLRVMQKSKLIAVCVNPTAPNGYIIDSNRLCSELSDAIQLPVYDIVKNNSTYEA